MKITPASAMPRRFRGDPFTVFSSSTGVSAPRGTAQVVAQPNPRCHRVHRIGWTTLLLQHRLRGFGGHLDLDLGDASPDARDGAGAVIVREREPGASRQRANERLNATGVAHADILLAVGPLERSVDHGVLEAPYRRPDNDVAGGVRGPLRREFRRREGEREPLSGRTVWAVLRGHRRQLAHEPGIIRARRRTALVVDQNRVATHAEVARSKE